MLSPSLHDASPIAGFPWLLVLVSRTDMGWQLWLKTQGHVPVLKAYKNSLMSFLGRKPETSTEHQENNKEIKCHIQAVTSIFVFPDPRMQTIQVFMCTHQQDSMIGIASWRPVFPFLPVWTYFNLTLNVTDTVFCGLLHVLERQIFNDL